MKKILAVLMAILMVASLAACGGNTSAPATEPAPAPAAANTTAPAAETTAPEQSLIDAAKAEGELVVYGSCEEDYLAAACAHFEELYGIKVQYQRLSTGEVQAKSGVDADSLFPLLEAAAAREHIRLRGLMAIPPADADDTETRRFFAQMRELLARADAQHYDRAQMDILSMGMSHDYAAAIAEGATIVRVGTAIYGARDYSKKA